MTVKKKYTKAELTQMVVDSLNEIGCPEADLKSNGGLVPDRMASKYGKWLKNNDPTAFHYAAQDMGIDLYNKVVKNVRF